MSAEHSRGPMLGYGDRVMIAVFGLLFVLVTGLGLLRVWYNTQEIKAGIRLDEASRALKRAESERVELSLVRSWLRQPQELRARAQREAGLEPVMPSHIIPLESARTDGDTL